MAEVLGKGLEVFRDRNDVREKLLDEIRIRKKREISFVNCFGSTSFDFKQRKVLCEIRAQLVEFPLR